jgi:DivIVA domain-containing protein
MSVVHGTIVGVTTVLFYLVVAAVIGLVVFFLAVFVFGRGEQMAPLDPRTSPAELPEADITAEDVRKIRFSMALRGYRMSDVDWTLDRLGEQIDQLRRENANLRGEPLPSEAAPAVAFADVDGPGDLAAVSAEPDAEVRLPVTVGAYASEFDGAGPASTSPFPASGDDSPPAPSSEGDEASPRWNQNKDDRR